jgi:hypothetical protein
MHLIAVSVGSLGRLDLGPTARTWKSLAGLVQSPKRSRIKESARALANDGLSPLKTQQAQCLDDAVGTADHLTSGIHVLNPDEPVAIGAARIKVAANCSDQ